MIKRSKKAGWSNRVFHYAWIHARPWLQQFRWFIILGFAVLALALGYIGFDRSYRAIGEPRADLDLIYLSIQLFLLESGSYVTPACWELQVARFLAPTLTMSTLIIFLSMLFYDCFKLFCLQFVKNHVVICGLGLLGTILARNFLEMDYPVVVIEKEAGTEEAEQCREEGAYVLPGDATHPDMLQRAKVKKAKYLISVLGDDGLNAEVASHAAQLVKDSGHLLSCFVHIVKPEICTFLRSREIAPLFPGAFRLGFINIYQIAGGAILRDYPPFRENEPNVQQVHLLVVGIGRMGESLIANAGKKWRELNGGTGKRLKISILDRDADKRKELLLHRYPSLGKYSELVALQMDIHSPEFEKGESLFENLNVSALTHVYICVGDETLGLYTALLLQQQLKTTTVPIIVRTNTDRGIATLLGDPGNKEYRDRFVNVHAFPLVSQTSGIDYILSTTHERIAQAVHEHYVEQQRIAGETPKTNPSMVSWDELPEDLKESNRKQADSIIEKLQAIQCDIELLTDWDEELFKFTPEEVEKLAIMEHNRFVTERTDQGYIFGKEKDITKKVSPYLKPYEDLPENVKEIDRNEIRTIPSILYRVDLKIIRVGAN